MYTSTARRLMYTCRLMYTSTAHRLMYTCRLMYTSTARRLIFTSTARRYKCNISDWIALVTGNILEMCSFNMALLLQ